MIIDTINKTIQVGTETLGEVVTQMQNSFPLTWKEFTILTPVFTYKEYPQTPICPIFREIPYVPYTPSTDPYNPWKITCQDGTLTNGDPSKFGTLGKTQESRDNITAIMKLAGKGWRYGIGIES